MRIFRNSSAGIAMVLGLIFIFQIDADATETRVGSMGGVGYYMRDNSNIFVFPGTFYTYANQVVGELRVRQSNYFYTVGAHLPISSNAQVGVYLNSPLYWQIPGGIVNTVTLDRTTDIFFGTRLSLFDLGLALRVAMDKDEINNPPTPETKESAHYFEVAGGISNEMMDLGLMVGLPSASYEFSDLKRTWSGFAASFNGRLWLKQQDLLFQFLPLIVANYVSTSAELDPGIPGAEITTVDYDVLELSGGVGINYQINQSNLIVIGLEAIGYHQESQKVKGGTEYTTTAIVLPGIYMGVESEISDWLTGRLGAAQTYTSITQKTKPDVGDELKETNFDKEFKMTFGLGFSFGNFLLDAAINEGLLFSGPNIISGTIQDFAYKLSITYNFGNTEENTDE